MRIGLLCKPHLPQAQPLAEAITAWLTERGVEVWQECSARAPVHPDLPQSDLLITLGGDGTVLRAVQAAAPHAVPVLGIHLGRVGFLTEIRPEQWEETLTQFLDGAGWLDTRALVRATVLRGGYPVLESDALNEAVLARSVPAARAIRLQAVLDGVDFGEHVLDALIVATATGSTAYASAAGGPVMSPWLKNLLWVPVAPYLSPDRALVLGAEAHIEVTVLPNVEQALTLDGQTVVLLKTGDRILLSRSPRQARFWRVGSREAFYRVLALRTFLRREGNHGRTTG